MFRPLVIGALLSVLSLPVSAQSGAMLAANEARSQRDYLAAGDYFLQAAQQLINNRFAVDNAVLNFVLAGDLEQAAPLVQILQDNKAHSPTSRLTMAAIFIKAGDFDAALALWDQGPVASGSSDAFLRAWVLLGAGQNEAAFAEFDAASAQENMAGFGGFQTALALAQTDQLEAALDKINQPDTSPTARRLLARAQILAGLGRMDKARETVAAYPNIPALAGFAAKLGDDPIAFDMTPTPADGVAEILHAVGSATRGDAGAETGLIYTQLAGYVASDPAPSLLLAGDKLMQIGSYGLAQDAYATVPESHDLYLSAQLGLGRALWRGENRSDAITMMQGLSTAFPDTPRVFRQLGDYLRSDQQYSDAVDAFDRAVTLIGTPIASDWGLFYNRAIAHHQQDNWAKAERDFRQALELSPKQHQVLNYLGYSLVERDEKLEEALRMIEDAVDQEPNAGYIVDSLGWALFKSGRYTQAVKHMERAAFLMPTDPVVNDHLGDAFWAVGRKVEAQVQWRRALSLVTEDTDTDDLNLDRIQAKLDKGLDAVLAEEGADPLVDTSGD